MSTRWIEMIVAIFFGNLLNILNKYSLLDFYFRKCAETGFCYLLMIANYSAKIKIAILQSVSERQGDD